MSNILQEPKLDTFQLFEIKSTLEAIRKEWMSERAANTELRLTLMKNKEKNEKLQNENIKLKNEIEIQRLEWANIGSTLGNLLWKTSNLTGVTEELMKERKKLSKLFAFATKKLKSMFPNNEDAFVTAMIGVFVNVCGTGKGTDVLLQDGQGKKLINANVRFLDRILNIPGDSSCAAEHLKCVLLMLLYNVCLDPYGFFVLKSEPNFIKTVCNDLINDGCTQKRGKIELKIIHSLLSHNDCETLKQIRTDLSMIQLKDISVSSQDEEFVQLSNAIIEYLKTYEEMFEFMEMFPQDKAAADNHPYDIDEDYIDKLIEQYKKSETNGECM